MQKPKKSNDSLIQLGIIIIFIYLLHNYLSNGVVIIFKAKLSIIRAYNILQNLYRTIQKLIVETKNMINIKFSCL